jgi:molybdopterin-containing oxidoreductase family iron-sulfur binding subunit
MAAAAADLQAHRGKSVIVAGDHQPPAVHALARSINETLGNVGATVTYETPVTASPADGAASIAELAKDMNAGNVNLLVILGGNPAFTAPADIGFASALSKLGATGTILHLGPYYDETAELCHWHVPEAHYLESWGDARSFDGTVTMIQPLIAPLYGGKSVHVLLGAMLHQQPIPSDYQVVREFWRAKNTWPDFEKGWRRALHDGLIEGTARPPRRVQLKLQNFPAQPQATGRKPEWRRRRVSRSCSVLIRICGTAASPTTAGCRNFPSR